MWAVSSLRQLDAARVHSGICGGQSGVFCSENSSFRPSVSFHRSATFIHSRSMFVCFWRDSPQWVRAASFTRFLDHTQQRTRVGRTPLNE
jgi:hypothetical protein